MMHLQDDFEISTVENEGAWNSPTIRLMRYLMDQLPLGVPAGYVPLANAQDFLARADEDMVDDAVDGENDTLLEEAAPIIAALTACIATPRSIHSLVINWSDNDTEQGTYGTSVKAWDHTHAEFLARAEMETSEDGGSDFEGTVVDHNVGASWLADDLEKALRGLVAVQPSESPIWSVSDDDFKAAVTTARELLDKIDAIT